MSYRSGYDLEERTFIFAKNVRILLKTINLSILNREDIKQLVRSSGSIGANYIEANESLGKKDFLMHLRISRKEAKESAYWIKLIMSSNDLEDKNKFGQLYQESIELKKILSAIIEKSK